MIKFKQNYIINPKTGVKHDIVVKSALPNKLKDAVIGGGMVLMGIVYLTMTAFKNGSEKFEDAELKALSDADLLDYGLELSNQKSLYS